MGASLFMPNQFKINIIAIKEAPKLRKGWPGSINRWDFVDPGIPGSYPLFECHILVPSQSYKSIFRNRSPIYRRSIFLMHNNVRYTILTDGGMIWHLQGNGEFASRWPKYLTISTWGVLLSVIKELYAN